MEDINQNEKRNQAWGTLTAAAEVQIAGTWGLTKINIDRVTTILSQYADLPQKTYLPRITLPALRVLIKVLNQNDLSLRKLNESIDTYFQGQNMAPQSTSSPIATIRAFNGKWILVAGTGDGSFAPDERLVSEILGRLLAEEGFGLISGGWQGVDFVVANSFAKSLLSTSQEVNDRLIQLLEPNQHSAYDFGRRIYTKSSDWSLDAVERADALVMIGGKGGTYNVYERFHRIIGKHLIPIASTGGDAQLAFHQLTEEGSPLTSDPSWDLLGGTIANAEHAEKVCQLVLHLLQQSSAPFLS